MRVIWFMVLFLISKIIIGQDNSNTDSITQKGWNIGVLPIVTYNSDLGLHIGALTNLFQYGNGDIYPEYYHSFYVEAGWYSKGSGVYRIFYDSKYLIYNTHLTVDILYNPNNSLNFFGFNGYNAVYNKKWTEPESSEYKTKVFYKHKRDVFRAIINFQKETVVKNIYWSAGVNILNIKTTSFDIKKYNQLHKPENKLPDVETLYDKYIKWGIISEKEKNGGFFLNFKIGLIYDSRNNTANATKGLWTEGVVFQSFNKGFVFTKLAFTHRQYFTLIKNKLSLAYRLSYQHTVRDKAPFSMLPYMVNSFSNSEIFDGLGGFTTIRGVMRNRIAGASVGYGNIELRWIFSDFHAFKQNFYLSFSPFVDFGQVVLKHKIDISMVPDDQRYLYFKDGSDNLHISCGSGLHLAMNHNFILTFSAGFPVNKQDGNMGFYMGLNYIF
jgi:hypothetical protein